MTNREFFEAIINNQITDEVVDHAKASIEKLDATNEKRKAKTAEKANVNAEFVTKLVAYLNDEPQTASDLLAKFVADGVERPEGKVFNVQFVSMLARTAVADGNATQTDVKVPKKGMQRGYLAV